MMANLRRSPAFLLLLLCVGGCTRHFFHKRADKDAWSASDRAQRRKVVKLLREVADRMEKQIDAPPATEGRRVRVNVKQPGIQIN